MNNLREALIKARLNQRGLAERSHVCQTIVSDLKRGVRQPWPNVTRKLSKVLKVPAGELFSGTE